MKITLDTKFVGSSGMVTLRDAVAQLKAQDLACTVARDKIEPKARMFAECVERGFTPLRSEIMAACYLAERDAAAESFDRGLITEGELEQTRLALARRFLGAA
ncbi:hypothetical protein OUY22_20510 [Nonomuraea sp. MCN248]|uniref:Uncharacterized protein n=1 Tax=Nonomuraea corallina TaxID=2989783 RepID=A0ABT4SFR5_9ACTN|nr:hypothetical protein [Nonomuraea corallina]MDA0635810.1 hypothetical protein [Nonomuraea corallina]